ncbi:MAG: hypothetical protein JO028_00365 [Acidobacteriaceae bacterium]|nr:hypothetical protein [Acidobacteriaceae bacterium]
MGVFSTDDVPPGRDPGKRSRERSDRLGRLTPLQTALGVPLYNPWEW